MQTSASRSLIAARKHAPPGPNPVLGPSDKNEEKRSQDSRITLEKQNNLPKIDNIDYPALRKESKNQKRPQEQNGRPAISPANGSLLLHKKSEASQAQKEARTKYGEGEIDVKPVRHRRYSQAKMKEYRLNDLEKRGWREVEARPGWVEREF